MKKTELVGDVLRELGVPDMCACNKPAHYAMRGDHGEEVMVCAECLAAAQEQHEYARKSRDAADEEADDESP